MVWLVAAMQHTSRATDFTLQVVTSRHMAHEPSVVSIHCTSTPTGAHTGTGSPAGRLYSLLYNSASHHSHGSVTRRTLWYGGARTPTKQHTFAFESYKHEANANETLPCHVHGRA